MSNPFVTLEKTEFSELNVSIPANSEITRDITGEFLRCMEASGSFKIGFQHSKKEFNFDVGVQIRTVNDELFTKARFINESAEAITARFLYGYGVVRDDRLNVVDGRLSSVERIMPAGTEIEVSTAVQILNGGSLTFDGVPTGNQVQRQSLIVTNEDPNNALDWTDATNVGGKIFAEQNLEFPLSGSITIANSSGGTITCKFTEIWFVIN